MTSDVLGAVAAVIAIVSLIPYIRDVWVGRTRPHLFTWLVWTLMTLIAFIAQVIGGGGPGAWATGATAALCVVVLSLSIARGDPQRTRFDWLCLTGCVLAGAVWVLTKNPTFSVALVSLIDALAFLPTYRKSWLRPHEETLATPALSNLKHLLSALALSKVTVVTACYPLTLLVMSVGLTAILATRRRALALS